MRFIGSVKRAGGRGISLLRSGRTAHDLYVPPVLGARTLPTVLATVLSIWPSLRVGAPFWLLGVVFMVVIAVDDLTAYRLHRIGMETGRAELVAEMADAWLSSDFDPREYLLREVHLGDAEEFRQRRIPRSVQVDPPESG
jgi:hypothetical protein